MYNLNRNTEWECPVCCLENALWTGQQFGLVQLVLSRQRETDSDGWEYSERSKRCVS